MPTRAGIAPSRETFDAALRSIQDMPTDKNPAVLVDEFLPKLIAAAQAKGFTSKESIVAALKRVSKSHRLGLTERKIRDAVRAGIPRVAAMPKVRVIQVEGQAVADPDPSVKVSDVVRALAKSRPELDGAKIEGPTEVGGVLTYIVKRKAAAGGGRTQHAGFGEDDVLK